jgi:hypothetical protein
VGKEVLVLGRENRVADNRRYAGVRCDDTVLAGKLDERLTVRVVNVADGGKFESHERTEVGQILTVEVHVIPRADRERDCADCDARHDGARHHRAGQPHAEAHLRAPRVCQ